MPSRTKRPANKLLRLLKEPAFQRVAAKLKLSRLRAKDILYKPNQRIHTVYFPETVVICQMTVMENGDTLETATVGLEGASWISASIGAPSMPCETVVATGGEYSAVTAERHRHDASRMSLQRAAQTVWLRRIGRASCRERVCLVV